MPENSQICEQINRMSQEASELSYEAPCPEEASNNKKLLPTPSEISETPLEEPQKGLCQRFLEFYSPLFFMDEGEEKELRKEGLKLLLEGKLQGFEGILELDYALTQIPINPMHYLPGPDSEDMGRMKSNTQRRRENYKNRVENYNRRWKEFQEKKNKKR